eukprot:m.47197 g.47197  ORF g.47197 m.47197 type:complete len:75 (+) comp10462_c0_seq3:60-284(+)
MIELITVVLAQCLDEAPLDFPFPKILLIRDIILTFGLVCFDFEFLDAVHSIQLLAYTCFNSPIDGRLFASPSNT